MPIKGIDFRYGKKVRIGFTIGDINGIGPEVLIKALSDHRILNYCTPVIFGSNKVLSFYKKLLDAEHFKYAHCDQVSDANPKLINVINTLPEEFIPDPGISSTAGGQAAMLSLEAAADALLDGQLDALVTAPINKHNMHEAGFTFPGHTEYLNHRAGGPGSLMMLLNDSMRVALATHHMPLQEVPGTLSVEYLVSKIRILATSLRQDFGIDKPLIALTGLNPHAGDQGLLGRDELEVIIPAMEQVRKDGIIVSGPFAADGLFGSGQISQFDAVLTMYHDQGLVGFKALSFDTGINYTAGMPFVRTSPDHGTAYDIAGKNVASATSMLQSIFCALDIYRTRLQYVQNHENPVKRTELAQERG